MPLVDAGVGDARTGLLLFLGVVTLVLLIACTNVANLMLARNAQRERELAIRTAMGAGRRRIIQQLLTESLVLSLAGGALGLMLASWGTRVLVVLLSSTAPIPRIEATHSDWWVLGFAFALSLADRDPLRRRARARRGPHDPQRHAARVQPLGHGECGAAAAPARS